MPLTTQGPSRRRIGTVVKRQAKVQQLQSLSGTGRWVRVAEGPTCGGLLGLTSQRNRLYNRVFVCV